VRFAVLLVLGHALAAALVAQDASAAWERATENARKAYEQGRYEEAEKQLKVALQEAESFEPRDPRLAATLEQVITVYRTQGKMVLAEPHYHRLLGIEEGTWGPDHPDLVPTLDALAWVCYGQRKFAEAEPLYWRSLVIWEKAVGSDHPTVATALDNLAGVYVAEEKFDKAEPLYRRALVIRQKATLASFDKLASLYIGETKYAQAEQLYQRAMSIAEKMSDPIELGMVLQKYAELLRMLDRNQEAETMEARIKEIRAKLREDRSRRSGKP
jgi:tetratricopeptide (TPR) repeat protein